MKKRGTMWRPAHPAARVLCVLAVPAAIIWYGKWTSGARALCGVVIVGAGLVAIATVITIASGPDPANKFTYGPWVTFPALVFGAAGAAWFLLKDPRAEETAE